MSRLAARIRTGTLLAIGAAGILWLAGQFPKGFVALVVVSAIALVCVYELDHMGSLRERRLGLGLYAATAATATCAALLLGPYVLLDARLGLALLYLVAGVVSLAAEERVVRVIAGSRLAASGLPATRERVPLALWLIPPLFAMVLVDRDYGQTGLVVLVVLAKVGDNAGYFVGRALGKRHPFPNVSPGKTVAGCVASLVSGIVVGAVLLPLTLGERTPVQFALGALVGGLVNVAAQAGDLSESWVKRRAGVKDSSTLVGPSGGVLDVVDSMLLAGPVALLAWSCIY